MKLFDLTLYTILLFFTGVFIGMAFRVELSNAKPLTTIYKIDSTDVSAQQDGVLIFNQIDTINCNKDYTTITKVNNECVKAKPAYNFNQDSTEYFAFPRDSFDYTYTPIKYTDYELLLFTNILYRESRDHSTLHTQIDQYFVCIAGIQRILCEPHKYPTVEDMVFRSGSFSYPLHVLTMRFDSTTHPRQYKVWMNCQKVVKNVLERNIPKYVPYLPKGTFCYWNSRIDTNLKQKHYLETRAYSVASTIWNHHYYVIDYYCDEKEKEYLIRNGLTYNPVIENGREILGLKKFAKPIKSGILCNVPI